MKLETAKDKLWPHRKKWHITITPEADQYVTIEAEPRGGIPIPGDLVGPWRKTARGFPTAMDVMARTLEAIEAAARYRRMSEAEVDNAVWIDD